MPDKRPLLLLVDDDEAFRYVMSQALYKRGFNIQQAESVDEAIQQCLKSLPAYALIDLNMPKKSGLILIKYLSDLNANINMVVLTGYASIATTVEAIKLGASYYLAKPVHADDIIDAFRKTNANTDIQIRQEKRTLGQIEWEHIQKILNDHHGNISATARALNMHRRTLQRKLQKRP